VCKNYTKTTKKSNKSDIIRDNALTDSGKDLSIGTVPVFCMQLKVYFTRYSSLGCYIRTVLILNFLHITFSFLIFVSVFNHCDLSTDFLYEYMDMDMYLAE